MASHQCCPGGPVIPIRWAPGRSWSERGDCDKFHLERFQPIIGGWIDGAIMRLADIQLSFPPLLIALLIDGVARTALPRDLHASISVHVVILAIGLSFWVQYARTVRGLTLVEQQKDYINAARLIGVHAVNQNVAWVSGDVGTFAVTTDGGATWHPGVVPGTAVDRHCGRPRRPPRLRRDPHLTRGAALSPSATR